MWVHLMYKFKLRHILTLSCLMLDGGPCYQIALDYSFSFFIARMAIFLHEVHRKDHVILGGLYHVVICLWFLFTAYSLLVMMV